MKSLRAWLVGIAVGVIVCMGSTASIAQSGVPRRITYQGMLEQNGAPFNGVVQLDFTFADSSGTTPLWQQTLAGVQVQNGIFSVLIGPFPESMGFEDQYSMSITVTGPSGSRTTLPPQLLWSSPYALNAERVNGMRASWFPVNGDLFPIPLNSEGRIDTSMLPEISSSHLQSSYVETINGTGPNANDNFQINAGSGISVTAGPNSITINNSAPASITSVYGTNGITGFGTQGSVVLGIAGGAITSNMLASSLSIGSASNAGASLAVVDSETNGGEALMVEGGIGASNSTGAADGTGLTAGSPQTMWADQVAVPSGTGTSLQVFNTLVSSTSTITVTAVGSSAAAGGVTITAQTGGSFTVSSKNTMGTSGGGTVTALNYIVVNH